MKVINPFRIESESARYEKYRPKYHQIPFQEIRKIVGREFESSLDVACGTGHSTVALSNFSKRTVGCDLSQAMLSEARKNMGIEFIQADAEELPFGDNEFDFVNISMGFHWVNQERFLREVKRVLKDAGYFCVDNYGFLGKVSTDAEKQKLQSDLFEKYLPPASRRSGYPTSDQVESLGFELVREISYEHKVSLNSEEFTNLIMTWSNFQVQTDDQKAITVRKMTEVHDHIFGDERLNLDFGGKAVLFRSV